MGFIQDDSIPLYHMKRCLRVRSTTFYCKNGVWCQCHVSFFDSPIWTIKDVDRQVWRESVDLLRPLGDNRFGYDDECTRLRVSKHSGNELYGLTQTHFVTEEPTFRSRRLALHREHPKNTFTLIGGKQTTIEGIFGAVILFFNRHRMDLLPGGVQSHKVVVVQVPFFYEVSLT